MQTKTDRCSVIVFGCGGQPVGVAEAREGLQQGVRRAWADGGLLRLCISGLGKLGEDLGGI